MFLESWLDIVLLKKYIHKCLGWGCAWEIETCLEFFGSASARILSVYISLIKQYQVNS